MEDEDGDGVPGVEIWLTWAEGADRAVTGLKPEEGLGYADFNATGGVAYTISVGEPGLPIVSGLTLENCPRETWTGQTILGSWRLVLAPSG